MSFLRRRAGRPRRSLLKLAVLLLGALAVAWLGPLAGSRATPRAAAQTPAPGEVTAQTDDSVPARSVMMIGSSPAEAAGETWGVGESGADGSGDWGIVRYASGAGWSRQPGPMTAGGGQALQGFEPAPGPLTAAVTPNGSIAMLARALVGPAGEPALAPRHIVLVRNPGGVLEETAVEPGSEGATPLLGAGEELFGRSRAPLVAALEEGARAGALVVPVNSSSSGSEEAVLHWDGNAQQWTREPIEGIPPAVKAQGGFRVLAIAASSPGNAWLLAQLSSQSDAVALFRRETSGSSSSWVAVAPAPGEPAAAPLSVAGEPFTVAGTGEAPTARAQILTVTSQGVWIDGERANEGTSLTTQVTMFFQPSGEGATSGRIAASWCNGAVPACTHELPDALPGAASRSFAWPGSGPFGQRVITGLNEGVSLRLEGEGFTRVLALGGGEAPDDVGGSEGAAFSSAREGWLGNEQMPVHLTSAPEANLLTQYPVPFRHALLAVAPQPGVAVGAASSEALAVGDDGEVARFTPGQGWLPESLLGPSGRHETPRLRAVAWPTPNRAYAVGNDPKNEGHAAMWLWRGETGLWEPDPATPLNFDGVLLGVAFQPGNPSRGYAVGQQGVLLRYGKSWTQETLPPEVQGASFTSVAFAGAEALVAFRVAHVETGVNGSNATYTGGVLVNSGSGWHVDAGAQEALGPDEIPWAVAGLPDGGAAISASDSAGQSPLVLERESEAAPWQPSPPFPGVEAPGSLALFRDGGALRAVAAGGAPVTLAIDTEAETPPPIGLPHFFARAYPLATGKGHVLRQTASGWDDQEHEFNEVREPPGEYKVYDTVYQPDPTAAVLLNEAGSEGWAVGGAVDTSDAEGRLDTADVARYPAGGELPVPQVPIAVNPGLATFAIGGDAQCQAPCSDRANARPGPNVWLSSALANAARTSGVRAFFFTGPHLTTGVGHGDFPVPYEREYASYASLLASTGHPVFPVAADTDRPGGTACAFQEGFAGFPAPFGSGPPGEGLSPVPTPPSRSGEGCGGQPDYYAMESTGAGGRVRAIVLEDASEVGGAQLEWLRAQLAAARGEGVAAIVIGSADLAGQAAAGQARAAEVARVLIAGGASAYFYDSPEQNVQKPLHAAGLGAASIPSFGSGTLGYGSAIAAEQSGYIGASGYLLAQVDAGARNPTSNVAPVTARLIPNVGELALEAEEGVLLRRSQAALFDGLARRPRAGGVATKGQTTNTAVQYIPIPSNCQGPQCGEAILPEYSFSSSNPKLGNFVEPELARSPRAVKLNPSTGKPIDDASSGLFCAFNAGQVTVTITAGGLSASLPVTIEPGSVEQPCGTTPLENPTSPSSSPAAAPPPAPAPAPAGPAPAPSPVPLVPPLPTPAVVSPPPPAKPPLPAVPPTFFLPPIPPAPLLAFVPPPVPTPARPTPPGGTSAVTSPVEAPEKQEESEEATESVGNNAVAYRAHEHEPAPAFILGLVLLAALAGASIRRPRRGGREVRVAAATTTQLRRQERIDRELRRR